MNLLKNPLVVAWQRLDSGRRRLLLIAATLILAVGVLVLSFWLRSEHARLAQREISVAADLKTIQSDLTEFGRLKSRAAPPKIVGQTLQESVVASLASRNLALTVTALDAGRLRIQGTGDFDAVVHWLGSVQQSYRLAVTSLSASRNQDAVIFDMTLSSALE
jgi:type II secretory pathway component PulM